VAMPSFVSAQIIIKEKVEINPVQPLQGENPIVIFPDSIYGGNGDRSVSNNPQYISDNPQSTIILPTGGTVTVRIISSEAAGDAKIDLLQNQPEQQTLTEYANHNLGFNWTSQSYPPGTNVEFGIYWYWNYYGTIYEGNEAGAIVTQLGANKYEIGFEAAGDDWDYNELVIQVTIEDFELLVDINPSEISTGETAVVTVRKQFYDGRIEDFPADQLFEFGMMEGCVAGGLVSGTDTAAYFNGVTQPILFVAADSLENDEETVRIGVGLVEQTIARPINSINKTVQKKILPKTSDEEVDKEKEISDILIIGGACSGSELSSTKQSFADLVVGGSICKKLPKCTENNAGKKPSFEIIDYPDGTDGKNVCGDDAGVTLMLWSTKANKMFLPITIENCYDENANVIQFGIKNDLITLRAIVTACEAAIISRRYTILYNTTELKTKVPQNLRALTQLYLDLDILLDYFTNERPISPYYPIELAWEHEFEHKRRYKDYIFNVVSKDFDYLDYSSLDVSCSKYSDLNDVLNEMKYNFEKRFSYFEKESIKYQFKVWGKKNGTEEEIENYKKNENDTHNAIAQKVIDKYKAEIKKLILGLPK
ncbi:MAG TPA: hypothetical protein PL018_15940, partial [Ignavibacteriaceae bacterium]|nr:hypothetical protein [Ignavibacteriaceae bacterium]HRQ55750.1 hypothetical protein [Ignavibacteriaceae bacterium]